MLKINVTDDEILVDCDVFSYRRQNSSSTFESKYGGDNKEYLSAMSGFADALDACFNSFGSELLAAGASVKYMTDKIKELEISKQTTVIVESNKGVKH